MMNLLKTPVRLAGTMFAAGVMVAAQGAVARPGMINYAEGQVALNGRNIAAQALGQTEIAPGQVLATQQGKAEVLLTPGVLLRVSDHSAVRMISPSITDTRVELLRGEAMVEAQQIRHENRLAVVDHGVETLLEKKGIYRFDADRPLVAVYDGKAKVLVNDREVDVGKGKELPLDAGALKPQKFDRDSVDSLYQWSKLRSQYLADANAASARTIVVENPGWYSGTGWYWNPWYHSWAFVPADGFGYSPFGFGFYSPSYWAYSRPVYVYPGRVWGGGTGRVWNGGRSAPMARPAQPGHVGGGAPRLGRGARM